MTNSILQKKWKRWYPKKILFKNKKNNQSRLCSSDTFIEEDFFIDSQNTEEVVQNKSNHESKLDLMESKKYKEGFEKGFLEAKQENILLEKKMYTLFVDFENALSIFENTLYSRLPKTVLKISSYVIGKKIDFDESILLKHIKKVIDKDGIFLKKPQLIIHPNNKVLIEKIFKDFLNIHKWKIVYDTSIDLNSCKVQSENGDMDATVDARWQELCRLIYSKEEY